MVLGKALEGLFYCLYDNFLLIRSLGQVDCPQGGLEGTQEGNWYRKTAALSM